MGVPEVVGEVENGGGIKNAERNKSVCAPYVGVGVGDIEVSGAAAVVED